MRLAVLLLVVVGVWVSGCGPAARPPEPGTAPAAPASGTPAPTSAVPAASSLATVPVENRREGGESAKVIDYVAPEVFPDLATLKAASDLVIRGRSESADRFAIVELPVNRLQVDPSTVLLRLIQQPPDAPPLHSDPPLVAGEEYVLFLRSFWGANSDRFRAGDHTFRPIGGPQGQWLVRDGVVSQQAEVPLKKALDGKPVDRFLAELKAAPDLRALGAALLQRHGWSPGELEAYMDVVASTAVLERDSEYRARLDASRGIGLDFAPYQGRQVLRLIYHLDPGGLDGCVLVADGKAVGAWLRIGGRGLIFRLDRREEALAALSGPKVEPSPAPGTLHQPDAASGTRPESARPTEAPVGANSPGALPTATPASMPTVSPAGTPTADGGPRDILDRLIGAQVQR